MGNFVKFALGGIFTFAGLVAIGYGVTIADEKVKREQDAAFWRGFNLGGDCQKIIDKHFNPIEKTTEEAPKQEED